MQRTFAVLKHYIHSRYTTRLSLLLALVGAVSFAQVSGTEIQDIDHDRDGIIGFSDFVAFAGAYNRLVSEDPSDSVYDYDMDQVVGFGDFLILASFWGQTYEPSVSTLLGTFSGQGPFSVETYRAP